MQGAATATGPDEFEDETVLNVVNGMVLKSTDDEEMTYVSHRALDAGRRQIMATAFPHVGTGKLLEVIAKKGSKTREFTVTFKGDTFQDPHILMGSCQITFEDLTPSECIEFSFAKDEPDTWHMAQLSQEALETYRGMKFDAWKSMLLSPTCEAQFRRMLQIGMISELYDPQVFPTPQALKAKYQVTDERTGKTIDLPHPVQALRVWDAGSQVYRVIETRMTGAPSCGEAEKWWQQFLEELNSTHGAEYISGLMAGK